MNTQYEDEAVVLQQTLDSLCERVIDEVVERSRKQFAVGIVDGPTEFERVAWAAIEPLVRADVEANVRDQLADMINDSKLAAKLTRRVINIVDVAAHVTEVLGR